jgi:hypothetical protein
MWEIWQTMEYNCRGALLEPWANKQTRTDEGNYEMYYAKILQTEYVSFAISPDKLQNNHNGTQHVEQTKQSDNSLVLAKKI